LDSVPQELKEGIHEATRSFLKRESGLLDRDNYEVTVSTALSIDVSKRFASPTYHVHAEYDKHGKKHKTLNGIGIRPDILIHHAGDDKANLLVIELKKGQNPDDDDLRKLTGMTDPKGEDGYRYTFGLFVGFSKNTNGKYNTHLQWFSKGKKIDQEILNADSGIPG